jgi:hypothetical protein
MCGIGVVLYIIHNHYMFIGYVPGVGIDNIDEFIPLWTLLVTKTKKDVKNLELMGVQSLSSSRQGKKMWHKI